MLRRLHPDQPATFAFTPANEKWARAQMKKFPDGRQASAIIPILWRAQEQEGWLSKPAIEHVADMLDLAYIRALEVASFYFMFQLQPVGSVAHIQVCGTLSCMICGAEDLIGLCRNKIADKPHELSADGKFSWEEVECLGACANAPMAQIGKDYYEDLTAARLGEIIDALAAGDVPVPGPQNGRFAAEPASGLTSLTAHNQDRAAYNASAQAAVGIGDTVRRIDGGEVPLLTPWIRDAGPDPAKKPKKAKSPKPAADLPADNTGITKQQAPARSKAKPTGKSNPGSVAEKKPRLMQAPRKAGADDLTQIGGVGPKLAALLNDMGVWHFDQIAGWGEKEIAWVDARLKFKGRIIRDDWVAQAATLAGKT